MNTVAACLEQVQERLYSILNDSHLAATEAWLLLEHVTNRSRASLLAGLHDTVTLEQQDKLDVLLHERVERRMPLQYLLGTVPFLNLDLLVRPPVLIPRPETEEIVDWVIRSFYTLRNEPLRILDMCTGSGCIALALASAFPNAQVIGVDISEQAVALARENALRNGIINTTFIHASLYDGLPEGYRCDVLIANPPYIAEQHFATLQPEVRLWEDKGALVAEHEGMALYEELLQGALSVIDIQGSVVKEQLPVIVLEIGIDQVVIKKLLEMHGFKRVNVLCDMSGKQRWAIGSI